jgi:hypothetical protein
MFPVLQLAFLFGTLKLADGYIIGHLCNRNLQPVNQLSEHGNLPLVVTGIHSGHQPHASWFLLRTL